MNKFKKYSFYIGIVGAILSCTSLVLNFFGIVDIMPIITEIAVIISTILISLGVVEKDDSANAKSLYSKVKDDIENQISQNLDETNSDEKAQNASLVQDANSNITQSDNLCKNDDPTQSDKSTQNDEVMQESIIIQTQNEDDNKGFESDSPAE